MSNLIVIRIIPQSPVDAGTFTNYLSYLDKCTVDDLFSSHL